MRRREFFPSLIGLETRSVPSEVVPIPPIGAEIGPLTPFPEPVPEPPPPAPGTFTEGFVSGFTGAFLDPLADLIDWLD
jgi:hypothetical protein